MNEESPYSWSPSACTLQPWQFWCGRCYHDALVRSDIENVGKARNSHQIPWSVREYHNFIIMFINFLIRIFSNWKGMNRPSKLGGVRQTRHGSQVTLAARRAVTLSVAPAAKLKNLRHFQWHLHSSHSSYKSEYLGKLCPLALQRPFLSTAKNGTWLNMRMKSAVGKLLSSQLVPEKSNKLAHLCSATKALVKFPQIIPRGKCAPNEVLNSPKKKRSINPSSFNVRQ